MARPHHRKKHKAHVRQYKNHNENIKAVPAAKTKASSLFAIVGALTGGAVGYFASQGSWIWIFAGLLLGTITGYLLGKKLD
jgi:uncharacterized membrane protein YfcA